MSPENNELTDQARALASQINRIAEERGITSQEAIELYIRQAMDTGKFEVADFMNQIREIASDDLERIEDVARRLRDEKSQES